MLVLFFAAVFFALCLYAAVYDIATLLIPNWLNAAIALLFFPAALTAGLGLETVGLHLAAGAAALAVSFGLFSLRVFGGGDAKMIPAVVLWLGPGAILPFLYWMALSGGVLAVALIASRRLTRETATAGWPRAFRAGETGAPYGVAIAAGAFVAASASPLLQAAAPVGIFAS